MAKLEVVRGDITTLAVDAIVNAANERMLGGGGVDGAIHRAAGKALYEACLAMPEVRPGVRCPTGTCQHTPGFDLPARFVIHTVGPVWRGGGHREEELLAQCYRESIRRAVALELDSIAIPAISCGAYGFPLEDAARIAVRTICDTLEKCDASLRVLLVALDAHVERSLAKAISEVCEREE